MASESFVVGCGGISFHQGVVMIDLVGLSANQTDDQGHPVREFRHRLVTTPPGLLEMFNTIQGMLDKLVEVGLLTRTGQDVTPGGAEPRPAQGPVSPPRTPNF